MIVHFPSALYPFSVALDWIALGSGAVTFSASGYYSLLTAIGTSGLAMIFGVIDLLRIGSKDKAWNTAMIHAGLNVLWLLCFATLLGIRMKNDPCAIQGIGYLVSSTLFVFGMLYSNFLGGELILKHGIGKGDQ